jgi:TonB family protein
MTDSVAVPMTSAFGGADDRSIDRFGCAIRRCALLFLLASCAATDPVAPWPSEVVPIERMRVTAPLRTSVSAAHADRSGSSEVVLLVHVDADGRPVRWKVEVSSGSGHLDEAAMHTVREARFVPFEIDGVARDVTVVARFRYPFKERARR